MDMKDELAQAIHNSEQHHAFAMEANDILRDLWNERVLDTYPKAKKRVAKLLGIRIDSVAV